VAYCFQTGEKVEVALRRIAAEQLEQILSELADESLSVHQRVHSARKRGKRIRGLLRLVRPGLGAACRRENVAIRDAGRLLSGLRDSQTVIDAFDKVVRQNRNAEGSVPEVTPPLTPPRQGEGNGTDLAAIRRGLIARREQLVRVPSDVGRRLAEFRGRIASVRQRVDRWRLKGDCRAAVRRGFKQTYARGRREMAAAYDHRSPESFHEWRKRVKDHWTHLLLLEDLCKPALKPLIELTKPLSDVLGEDHDLAVLVAELQAAPQDFGGDEAVAAFTQLAEQRRERLQAEARALGERLYVAKPKRLARRIESLWQAWEKAA